MYVVVKSEYRDDDIWFYRLLVNENEMERRSTIGNRWLLSDLELPGPIPHAAPILSHNQKYVHVLSGSKLWQYIYIHKLDAIYGESDCWTVDKRSRH